MSVKCILSLFLITEKPGGQLFQLAVYSTFCALSCDALSFWKKLFLKYPDAFLFRPTRCVKKCFE
jgi:hypothetical protein